ncbi:TPA: hypothetical protein ACH3X1_003769 [Trebouxia sp. C0004]
MWRLMHFSNAPMRRAMAAEVGKSGAVAVLMRIVERKRLAGQGCLVLLMILAFSRSISVPLKAHIQDLLSKANGMLHCSMQLCPWFPKADKLEYPEAVNIFSSSWVESSTVSSSFTIEGIQSMLEKLLSVVDMVHRLAVLGNPCWLQQAPPRKTLRPVTLRFCQMHLVDFSWMSAPPASSALTSASVSKALTLVQPHSGLHLCISKPFQVDRLTAGKQ